MFHVLDPRGGRGQNRGVRIEAGMAAEGASGEDGCHREDHVCPHSSTQGNDDGDHDRGDSPGGTGRKSQN